MLPLQCKIKHAVVYTATTVLAIANCNCRPLCESDVQGAALVLTRAFAGTAEAVKLDEAL
jgi:hypothetical protein